MLDELQLRRGSLKPPRISHWREVTLTVWGVTAGGSGMASTEAITITTPSIHAAYEINFIPAYVPNVMITNLQRCNPASLPGAVGHFDPLRQ
jgi:hypothetical protein